VKWSTPIGELMSSSGFSNVVPTSRSDQTYNYAGTGGPIDYATPASLYSKLGQKQFSQELRFTSRRMGALELQVGGFYQHGTADVTVTYDPFTVDGQRDRTVATLAENYLTSTLNEYAAFVNGTVYLSERFDVTAGFRHSRINQRSNSLFSGELYGLPGSTERDDTSSRENADTYQAGARWRPTTGLMLYLRAASGYRPGGARSLPPGTSPDLKPFFVSDSIWSYEAGIKTHALGGRLTFDADVFRIDWSDIQALVYISGIGVTGNGGTARSQGGEVQASFMPMKGLILSGNAAYTDAKFTQDAPEILKVKGELIPYIPKWTATADLGYACELENDMRAQVGATYVYRGSTLDSFAEPYNLPGYSSVDIRSGIELKNFSVNLYVNNLTNKRAITSTAQGYYTAFNPFIVNVNQPRTYGLRFSQKF
jgi:outer membrane receptor protein involved in Fe transport